MQLKNIINLFKNINFLYLLLFLWILLIRFPYLFIDKIAPDENIFFILGDLILQGELPHENYWDIKPAMVWYLYSIPQLFIKSIISLRFFGIIIIFLSSLFLFKIIYENEKNKFTAFLASFLFVFASTFIGTELPDHSIGISVGIITQHFANFFLILSIFFIFRGNSSLNIFLVSLFLSLAILTRYNYALILIGYLLYYLFYKKGLKFFIIFSFTSLISFLIVHFSYFSETRYINLIEYFEILKQYGSKETFNDYFLVINKFSRFILEPLINFRILNTRFYLSLFFWISGMIFVFMYFFKEKTKVETFFIINFSLIMLSIFVGAAAEHYLLSVIIFISYFSAKTINSFSIKKLKYLPILIVLISSFNSVKSEYFWLAARILNNQSLMVGPGFDILNYMKKNKLPIEKNLYLSQPILYFLTDQKPVHKLIFPTQFNAHATTIGNFDEVSDLYLSLFKKKPNLVVFDENQWNIKANKEIYKVVKNEISINYNEVYKTQSTKLYIRRQF